MLFITEQNSLIIYTLRLNVHKNAYTWQNMTKNVEKNNKLLYITFLSDDDAFHIEISELNIEKYGTIDFGYVLETGLNFTY